MAAQERRNIAIIAHVDHGKTTMVDKLFQASGVYREGQQGEERAMDSGDLERERGITISAKVASFEWKGVRINLVDTPGHADFGGEVERILSMVDGVLLLVDAAEGAMPQTKFVTMKALALGLNPVVVINKMDRKDARADFVHESVFDLFAALGANDDQLDFPVLYASAREGWASNEQVTEGDDMDALLDAIIEHVPAPKDLGEENAPFELLAIGIESDPFLGRILSGRIKSGTIEPNMTIKALSRDGKERERGRVTKVLAFRGPLREPVESAEAGDIVAIAGLKHATVSDTLCDPSIMEAIDAQPVDPPTLAITMTVNDSPLAGREGSKVQSRVIRERLLREAEGNVAIRVSEGTEGDAYEVAGRGELQLGILIETMRREGFEMSISRPRVIMKKDEDGKTLEPAEEVQIDVDEEYSGVVIDKLTQRKAELNGMAPSGAGKTRLTFIAPARSLIGYQGEFMTDTRGTGIMSRIFHGWVPYAGEIGGRHHGVLIANSEGEAVAFALWNLENRGSLFITPGTKVYRGMIIGANSRPDDLEVNPLKGKQLTNIRTNSRDEAVKLTTVQPMALEQAISYIGDDELVEITPENIRLRKRYLDPNERKRNRSAAAAQ
ncbi:GTP-binding protein TypA/BipA [Candidatus Phaeomarinobacter ectocarpi]|uniref:Large ribosomal subunit assembly factor BipA n=1 Tax=Candidatus Phaeomarinibacter ectocarpi TaxID=1458461 RepID=X5M7A2_9HYPH|nr:translational GTPase TypA [Candidatus Phaeomarinobacter ectocarpi]CDO58998.1 GTP-binding protein TypA/BipA [Candidatus Phaeomarinobacter ectocarpi]